MEERELFERFMEEFKAFCEDGQPVILELDKVQAWTLFS
jgi:hypothetical protein